MSNISNKNKTYLKSSFKFPSMKISKLLEDKENGTIKFLFELEDKNLIESVVMNFEYGNSLCITTQASCNMGCKFCVSGQLKRGFMLCKLILYNSVDDTNFACSTNIMNFINEFKKEILL